MSTISKGSQSACRKSVRPKEIKDCKGTSGKEVHAVENEGNEEQEETVTAKIAAAGKRPTAIEVEEHMNTHLPSQIVSQILTMHTYVCAVCVSDSVLRHTRQGRDQRAYACAYGGVWCTVRECVCSCACVVCCR